MPAVVAGFPQDASADDQHEVDIELHNQSLITYNEFIAAANIHKATI